MLKNIFIILLVSFYCINPTLYAQVENVPISNPVYEYLLRAESRGFLESNSLSDLPLQKSKVIECLKQIRTNVSELSQNDIEALENYEKRFEISKVENAVLFYSASDSTQIFSKDMFGESNKYFYRYKDTSKSVYVQYLAELDYKRELNESKRSSLLINQGFRISGSISNYFGYNLQATNGAILGGDRDFAKEDERLSQNVKFNDLNSDFDMTESHIAFVYDWFYASIGRESRQLGAGLEQKMFISTHSPASDALTLAAKFDSFEYKFIHNSLLSESEGIVDNGFVAFYPPKYSVMHRASFRANYLEVSLWESVIYTRRDLDLAYLNPFAFLKSTEHSLHDRDNSIMGFDATIRPLSGLQVKGSYLLDDIIFSKMGTGFWSNKAAWNISLLYSFKLPIDIGIEYARVEPYTFSHFNRQNAVTNDAYLFGSILPPNSDNITLKFNYWISGAYPLSLKLSRFRHGQNILDSEGKIVRNVGGDYLEVKMAGRDSDVVTFLDGNLLEQTRAELSYAWEFINGFHLHFLFGLNNSNEINTSYSRLTFRFQDF